MTQADKPGGFLGIDWDSILNKGLDVTGSVLEAEINSKAQQSGNRADPYPAVQRTGANPDQMKMIGIGVAAVVVIGAVVLIASLFKK
jgi:hypothetical protein